MLWITGKKSRVIDLILSDDNLHVHVSTLVYSKRLLSEYLSDFVFYSKTFTYGLNVNQKIMSVAISYNGGVYEINGFLTSQNSDYFHDYFEVLLKHSIGVVVILNKVSSIDRFAVQQMVAMYKDALSCDQIFYIIGKSNPIVWDQFKALEVDDILM